MWCTTLPHRALLQAEDCVIAAGGFEVLVAPKAVFTAEHFHRRQLDTAAIPAVSRELRHQLAESRSIRDARTAEKLITRRWQTP